ncbi:MAG TPA: TRAP transporter substrate-binding protein DctP [Alphaproteobacteria bacterium]
MLKRKAFLALAASALALCLAPISSTSAEEVTLKAISFVPKQLNYAQSFAKWVDEFNKQAKGVLQINFIGGPEVTPSNQQGQALKNGLIDMIFCPPGLYLNLMPEGEAISGSNKTPLELRKDGAYDLLDKIMRKRLNATLIAHVAGGNKFYIWLKDEPKRLPDGSIDFSGIKLRTSPLWKEFFTAIGATTIIIPNTEVYTALERGTVDGTGWPVIGLRDYKWDKFVRYRVEPGFMQPDILISVNLPKFNSLSKQAQDMLTTAGVKYEAASYAEFQAIEKADKEAMQKEGMKVVELTGAARDKYLQHAYAAPWARMKERNIPEYDELRAKFFDSK